MSNHGNYDFRAFQLIVLARCLLGVLKGVGWLMATLDTLQTSQHIAFADQQSGHLSLMVAAWLRVLRLADSFTQMAPLLVLLSMQKSLSEQV